MRTKWSRKWKGGRVAIGVGGEPVYVLERMVAGQRYTISMDVTSERDADAELALFLRDPSSYQTKSAVRAEVEHNKLLIDDKLVGRFLKHLRSAECSEKYIDDTKRYLASWAEALGDKDLRRQELKDFQSALKAMAGARQQRIAAIKSFCSFLREEEGVLKRAEDATLDLKVPQSKPEKNFRKKGYSMEHVQRLFGGLGDKVIRDVLVVRAKTGLHGSELRRLVAGRGRVAPVDGHTEIAGTLTVLHKSGDTHIQSVDAETLDALMRLVAHGKIPHDKQINTALDKAARAVGEETIRLGELRHSFVEWAKNRGTVVKPLEGGVSLKTVSETIGHKDQRTTKRFYDGTEVPQLIKLPMIF